MPPPSSSQPRWLICTDTGGTFTDCLARDPDGAMHRAKVLSTSALRGRIRNVLDERRIEVEQHWGACDDLITGFEVRRLDSGEVIGRVARFDAAGSIMEFPNEPARHAALARLGAGALIEAKSDEPAPILAARLVTRTPAGEPLPLMHLRLATTRGTNALLERRGAETALFITRGFADLLHIGDQSRPDLFALDIIKPQPPHQHVVEVDVRLNADGTVLRALEERPLRDAAMRLQSQGVHVAAVALMHSHVNPSHEHRVASILRDCGFTHVSESASLAPLIRLLPRAQTAVVDAYLAPIIADYLQNVQVTIDRRHDASTASRVHVMTSAGALHEASRFRACESLLSGPAGGVLGVAEAARASGFNKVIGFDMGGTSTDVCRWDGELDYRFEHRVGDARLLLPALAVETVAAGGGSICEVIDGLMHVGPRSAGADPGPACYGFNGPLTITDVNLLLGRLLPDQFEIPISTDAANAASLTVLASIRQDAQASLQAAEMLSGFIAIANQRMASAIEQVSLRQGYDPREYALVSFGGAGGQHACAIADLLGMTAIVMPRDASLLSAVGLMTARVERLAQRQVLQTLDQCAAGLVELIHTLARQATADVEAEGVERSRIDVRRVIANVRLVGQDTSLQIEITADDGEDVAAVLRDRFSRRYAEVYGHPPALVRKAIELESLRVVASADVREPDSHIDSQQCQVRAMAVSHTRRVFISGAWREIAMFDREHLVAGSTFAGPAIVADRRSSYLIEVGWRAHIDDAGAIVVNRTRADLSPSTQSEPVRLELISHRFMAIASEMGEMLQRTALSTNVKERLDFSCTLLDAEGRLVANAPHLPVHLGAMGVCVRAVRQHMALHAGDVIVTNHPAFGGSHLPDITVIAPVFDGAGELIGHVANRAHHAEIGGTRPGSMPPQAKTLAEEGVVIAPTYLVRAGDPQWEAVERLLASGAHPSRAVADNIADLRAQLAAVRRGADALRQMVMRHGREEIRRHMQAVTSHAARLASEALARLPARTHEAIERLDDGSQLHVCVDLTQRPVLIDFAGTSLQHPGNLNATPAIVRSAVIYVLRLLVGERLPLNEGLMEAVDVRIPRGSLLDPIFDTADPTRCPAVVGGNTETSQRLVDTLLKAFGLAACSQGTMNNTLFGNDRFGYYETVCGGAGATAHAAGAHAVHTHMTNTRITDPEVIEHRYPVRLERFAIRRGSGGMGVYRGGDGAVREIVFLETMSLSMLTQHRIEAPFGMNGGHEGRRGSQRVIRAGGETVELRSIDGCEVLAGDRLILETPGGGG